MNKEEIDLEKEIDVLKGKVDSITNEYRQKKAKFLGTNILSVFYDGIRSTQNGGVIYEPLLKQYGDKIFLYTLTVKLISKDTEKIFLAITASVKMECILDDKKYTKTFASYCGLGLLHPILRGLVRDITIENDCIDLGVVFPKKINKITTYKMLEGYE